MDVAGGLKPRHPESADEEIKRLRACLDNLVGLMALPALSTAGEPPAIVGPLLDGLLERLPLAFVYARLNDPNGSPVVELSRVSAPLERLAQGRALGTALDGALGDAPLEWPPHRRLLMESVELSVASAQLRREGLIGIVVAGSLRLDFPAPAERILLDVAANQAVVYLQQARLLHLERAEKALRERERESRLVIDTIPALVWSARPDGSAEFFNKHYLDFVGLSTEQASFWGWTRAVHPQDMEGLGAAWQRIMASQASGEAEARLRRHDGKYRWFLFRANPLRDEKGNIVKWYGVNTDIEDRKRAEAEVRRAYDSFADAQRLSKTGSFITDLVGDDHNWSREAFRIFAFEPGTKVSVQRIRDIIHPDDLPAFEAVIARGMTGGDGDFAFRIVTASGAMKHVRGIAHVIEQVEGRPMFAGALQDVTESMVAEEALSRARSDLAHVARVTTVSALTASIAHEVNQPLSGIITNAGTCLRMLAADPPDIDGARETARRTIRDSNRASDVIARLRALFGKKEFTLETLDLNEATREVIALSSSDLQRNRIVLRAELADDLPTINGDRIQIQQVVLNLLRNGSEAMAAVHDRPRQLLIRTERETAERVRLTVRDAGIGIDGQSMDKLFDPFYTTKSGGMGIGLSVSRSIVEIHQGRLWAEANEGPGATFAFSIPLALQGATGAIS